MPERRNEHRSKRDNRFERNIRRCIQHWADTKIDNAIAQLLQALLTGNIVQREHDSRMFCRKLLHGSRQYIMNGGFPCRYREPALLDVVAAGFKNFVPTGESPDKRPPPLILKMALGQDFYFLPPS